MDKQTLQRWLEAEDLAALLVGQAKLDYPFTLGKFNSTMPGKIRIVVPDQATAVGASATVSGVAANKGTTTDLVLVISGTGGSGTVTPQVQGANAAGGPWTNVNPDKANVALSGGALPALVYTTGNTLVVAHYAQLQWQLYRVQFVSAATSGVTATDAFLFMPVEDSFDSTVA